jgi:hypothetical protein
MSCPICGLGRIQEIAETFGKSIFHCPRCGRFAVTYEKNSDRTIPSGGPKISAFIRNLNEQGVEVPEINHHTIMDLQKTFAIIALAKSRSSFFKI